MEVVLPVAERKILKGEEREKRREKRERGERGDSGLLIREGRTASLDVYHHGGQILR